MMCNWPSVSICLRDEGTCSSNLQPFSMHCSIYRYWFQSGCGRCRQPCGAPVAPSHLSVWSFTWRIKHMGGFGFQATILHWRPLYWWCCCVFNPTDNIIQLCFHTTGHLTHWTAWSRCFESSHKHLARRTMRSFPVFHDGIDDDNDISASYKICRPPQWQWI